MMTEKRMGEHALPPLVLPQTLTPESNRAMSEWMLQIEDARTERAEIVAWLRAKADANVNGTFGQLILREVANCLERGEHRKDWRSEPPDPDAWRTMSLD